MNKAVALLLALLTSHCATPQPVPSPPVPRDGRCGGTLGPAPFHRPRALHVLVAGFNGKSLSEPDLPHRVSTQLLHVLEALQEEAFRAPRESEPKALEDTLEILPLSCSLESHEHADAVARALGAQVVIWGQAFRNPTTSTVVNDHSQTTVESITVGDNSTITIGNLEVRASKPYTVQFKATWHRPGHRFLAGEAPGLDVASLGHLDWQTLRNTEPILLLYFALGFHFHEQKDDWLAAQFFDNSASQVLRQERSEEEFERVLAETYLSLPDPDRSLAYSRQALERVRGLGNPMEGTLLTLIGRALQAQGKDEEALESFRQALMLTESALGEEHPESRAARIRLALAIAQKNGWAPERGTGGAVVVRCLAAMCAGLLPGDWLVAYDETAIRDAPHLKELIQRTAPERHVTLSVIRSGQALRLSFQGGPREVELP